MPRKFTYILFHFRTLDKFPRFKHIDTECYNYDETLHLHPPAITKLASLMTMMKLHTRCLGGIIITAILST
jgi:hypothetical protein